MIIGDALRQYHLFNLLTPGSAKSKIDNFFEI